VALRRPALRGPVGRDRRVRSGGCDAAIFVLLAHQLATAPAALAPVPVSAAASASLARLALSGRAARRCLTAQAALTGPDPDR
jgi:hypothetical protein